jgi:hypothetical protein
MTTKLIKKSSYKIIDNALDDAVFKNLSNLICSDTFSWYFNTQVAYRTDTVEQKNNPLTELQERYNNMYTHTVFVDNCLNTKESIRDAISPVNKMLNMKCLMRCKINNYGRTPELLHHQDHRDYPFKHKGALFYINDCDGLTVLEDGTEIKSVANRLLLFDPSKPHHSTTTTNAPRRININLNYF